MFLSEALEDRALQKTTIQNSQSAFTPKSALEKRETSIVKARVWASRAKENWVLKRNQYGDWTRRTCVLFKWTLSNIIRLQELRFDIHRFVDLFGNGWSHLCHRNSRMWHGRSREKSRDRSCKVCYELRFKIIKEIPGEPFPVLLIIPVL